MRLTLSILGLLLGALAGVVAATEFGGPAAVLARTDLEFGKDTATRGLDGWLSHFADDAAIFPPKGPIIRGLAEIRAHYEKTGFTGAGLTWQPVHAELSSSGDLGYTFGTWEWTGTGPDGKEIRRTGKYTTIWRKQADGSWKLVVDIGSADQTSE